jgi:hypothetical protein
MYLVHLGSSYGKLALNSDLKIVPELQQNEYRFFFESQARLAEGKQTLSHRTNKIKNIQKSNLASAMRFRVPSSITPVATSPMRFKQTTKPSREFHCYY